MKSALIIFNGIKFPYNLMEFVLAHVKQEQIPLHVLFLKAQKGVSEGYGFPSDINQTEEIDGIKNAQKEDISLINHHMKLAVDMAAFEGITCTTQLITDCSLKEILKIIDNHDEVYVDAAFDDDNTSMLNSNKFSLKDLIAQASSPIKVVSKDDSTPK